MSDESDVKLSNSVINLDGLAKPVTRLIEKLSDGVGALYHPRKIKNLARAEVEAAKIKAEGALEISEIQRRGFYRLIEQEEKYQSNFENVVRLALPEVKDDATPEAMDNDWLTRFFEEAKLFSDEEMQSLWSRILAGEANTPGTFSKRTLQFVSGLDKNDAEMFTTLMGFAWFIEGEYEPFVADHNDSIYTANHIRFDTLSHLDNIGLIKFGGAQHFMRHRLPKILSVSYFGTAVTLEFKRADNENELPIGNVLLTKVGQELASISGANTVGGFVEYSLKQWQNQEVTISSTFPNRD